MKDNLSTYSSSVSAQLQPSPCSERLASWLWEGSSLRISARKKKKEKKKGMKAGKKKVPLTQTVSIHVWEAHR